MKLTPQGVVKPRRQRRREAVILFAVANQRFAIAADAVHEIRSADSLSGAAVEIEQRELDKVRHTVERARRVFYIVSASAHFGLRRTRPTMVLMLRESPAAVLVDRIENMVEISGVYPLPLAFAGEERAWYRGLAYFDDQVIPVVNPLGFLTAEELRRLERAAHRAAVGASEIQGTVPV
jgi:chemotaxis signal transduction protein